MSPNSGSSAAPAEQPETPLIERVRNRVRRAHGLIDRRDSRARRRMGGSGDATLMGSGSSAPISREVRALRVVFREMGRTHRQYRRQTQAPISTDLRSAAIAFRQEPSLMSLIPVASFLDEMRLLEW